MPKRYLRLPDGSLVEWKGGSGGAGGVDREEFEARADEVRRQSEAIDDLELGGNAGTVSAIQSVFSDIVTFLKAVPFDDTVVSASDLDEIQSKIDTLGSRNGGTNEPEQPDEPVESK